MAVTLKSKGAHTHILSLPPDKRDAVDAMLFKGHSAPKVASHIHEEWGLLTNVKHDTLKKALNRYKKQVLEGQLVGTFETVDEQGNTVIEKIEFSAYRPQLDSHALLQDIVIMQQSRLNKALSMEKGSAMLMDSTHKELKLYTEMVTRLSDLEVKLGLLSKLPDNGGDGANETVLVDQFSGQVIGRPELRTGLTLAISSLMQKVDSLPDDYAEDDEGEDSEFYSGG